MFNRLKRELRINKHGVAVTKHVIADPEPPRESLAKVVTFSKPPVNPVFEQQRAQFRSDLMGDLDASSHDVNKDATKRIALEDYSKWTLEVLHNAFHGTGELEQFMSRSKLMDEDLVRAGVMFKDMDVYPNVAPENVLEAVRTPASEVLGLFNLSDAEAGSDQHEAVSTMVRVATESAKLIEDRRSTSEYAANGRFASKYVRGSGNLLMPNDLAEVIVDYPDRGDDIVKFIKDHCADGDPVDSGFLRVHLDNPTPALADGLL